MVKYLKLDEHFLNLPLIHTPINYISILLVRINYKLFFSNSLLLIVMIEFSFLGLSSRDLILQFRHKVLLLFKLMLLERKVIFFRSPVQPLCAALLSLLSLHPGMLEHGLSQSSYVK